MGHQFKHHYTLEEARAMLPEIRQWLELLGSLRSRMRKDEQSVEKLMAGGADAGGRLVDQWIRTLVEIRTVLAEFQTREIQLKDVERGLLDFPAIIHGREVFLCWEKDEDDIEHWHDLDAGYAGRERL